LVTTKLGINFVIKDSKVKCITFGVNYFHYSNYYQTIIFDSEIISDFIRLTKNLIIIEILAVVFVNLRIKFMPIIG
jgi:hypothetical protein